MSSLRATQLAGEGGDKGRVWGPNRCFSKREGGGRKLCSVLSNLSPDPDLLPGAATNIPQLEVKENLK